MIIAVTDGNEKVTVQIAQHPKLKWIVFMAYQSRFFDDNLRVHAFHAEQSGADQTIHACGKSK